MWSKIIHVEVGHHDERGGSSGNRRPGDGPGVDDEIAESPQPCDVPPGRHAKGQVVRRGTAPILSVGAVEVGQALKVEEVG